MSAISAVAVTINPPAPTPCTARHATSQDMDPATAHMRDAATKIAALNWKTRLRPNWSPNLPASTTAIVSAMR